ncbi:MAG: hypothetical protein KDI04_04845, partial [Halieaceae bacterium]|nr:hypothetical protein [Halieaceae bacterium]
SAATRALPGLQGGDRIIADPVAGLLPGLAQQLPGLEILQADSVRQALEQQLDALVQRGRALSFVTALPALGGQGPTEATPEPEPAAPRPPPVAAATHLLQGHRARPLAADGTSLGQGWELFRDARGWQLRGSGAAQVNDAPYRAGQILGGGDTIRLDDGASWRLIEVAARGEAQG